MNKIKQLRLSKGLSQRELAEAVGLKNFTSIYFYETEKRPISYKIASKFANYFNVSVDYLLGNSDADSTLTTSIIEMPPISLNTKVPIYGSVSAGKPVFCSENIEGYTYLADVHDTPNVFCLRINGNSMNLAGLPNGALAIVHKQSIVDNGDIAVIRVNDDEALIKRFYRDGEFVHLRPESTDTQYKELTYDLMKTSVYIIGKVIGSQIRF